MKIPIAILFLAVLITSTRSASAAETAGGGLLQKGLYEEEANHDLKAAIEAYQALTWNDIIQSYYGCAIRRVGQASRLSSAFRSTLHGSGRFVIEKTVQEETDDRK